MKLNLLCHHVKKLEHYGVRDTSLKWFRSYSDPTHSMFSVTIYLQQHYITCGVPQSIIVFTNDLPNISNELSFHLFADDTNIFFEASNLDTLNKPLVIAQLYKFVNWLNSNRLALNVSKTNFVIQTRRTNFQRGAGKSEEKKAHVYKIY